MSTLSHANTAGEIDAYDVVFIGSPNWWHTVAPPVMTFLDTHDLAGKAAVPFITHEGTGPGQSGPLPEDDHAGGAGGPGK